MSRDAYLKRRRHSTKMALFTQVSCSHEGPHDDILTSKAEDVILDNVLVNYVDDDVRFSHIQLGDLGGSYPADSKYAKEGTPVRAPMWTSPEVIMETPWNTATDIWSFGTVVCSNHDLRTR